MPQVVPNPPRYLPPILGFRLVFVLIRAEICFLSVFK
jgi:hypothetical protein